MPTVCGVLIKLLADSDRLHNFQPLPFTALYCTRAYEADFPISPFSVERWAMNDRNLNLGSQPSAHEHLWSISNVSSHCHGATGHVTNNMRLQSRSMGDNALQMILSTHFDSRRKTRVPEMEDEPIFPEAMLATRNWLAEGRDTLLMKHHIFRNEEGWIRAGVGLNIHSLFYRYVFCAADDLANS